jgi:hypothetical protein
MIEKIDVLLDENYMNKATDVAIDLDQDHFGRQLSDQNIIEQ